MFSEHLYSSSPARTSSWCPARHQWWRPDPSLWSSEDLYGLKEQDEREGLTANSTQVRCTRDSLFSLLDAVTASTNFLYGLSKGKSTVKSLQEFDYTHMGFLCWDVLSVSFININIDLSFSTWLYETHQSLMFGHFVLPRLCLVRCTFEFPRHLLHETQRNRPGAVFTDP